MVYLLGYRDGVNGEPAELASKAVAEESGVSPVKATNERDVYYPNTEDLAPDEMRVIACGTGMPTTRAAQAAACFLVELGNGDKFLFDMDSGMLANLFSLRGNPHFTST